MHTFKVSGMSCGHCVRAITQAVQALEATAEVQVDLATAEVKVASQLAAQQIAAAISEQGYEVRPVAASACEIATATRAAGRENSC